MDHTESEIPLVSIGIPTYNRAEKLNRTLNSLLEQTYQNVEIIVSDNCSSDTDVVDVVGKYANADPRITYIRQQTNIGATDNFEFVKQRAKGDFFLWAADDDYIDQDYIEKCVNYLVANPEIVLVGGRAKFYGPKDIHYFGELICLSDESPEIRVFNYLKRVSGNSIFYGVYKTSVIQQVNLCNILAGDWLFIGEIAILGKIWTLSDTFIHREASHLFLEDPWGRLCSYYNLPLSAKRFPELWIMLELKNGFNRSEIVGHNFNNLKFSWKVFRLLLCEKYAKKNTLENMPYYLITILFYIIFWSRRNR